MTIASTWAGMPAAGQINSLAVTAQKTTKSAAILTTHRRHGCGRVSARRPPPRRERIAWLGSSESADFASACWDNVLPLCGGIERRFGAATGMSLQVDVQPRLGACESLCILRTAFHATQPRQAEEHVVIPPVSPSLRREAFA
jgi:hypothetical protein